MQNIAFSTQWIQHTNSTNVYAWELVKKEPSTNKLVIACHCQTAGKGQGGNSWESEAYKNLSFSVILKPHFLPADKQFLLSQAVSLAIIDFLTTHQITAKIKWPNDIYIGDKKLAGILIENSLRGATMQQSIVGIGMNINQINFMSNTPNPVSLRQITNKEYDLKTELNTLIACLETRYLQLMNDYTDKIQQAYTSNMYRYQIPANYQVKDEVKQGSIQGVNSYGQLLVQFADGLQIFNFKEIRYSTC